MSRGRPFEAGVIRFDEQGRPWLMNRRAGGWGSHGLMYPTLDSLLAAWDIELGERGEDADGPYVEFRPAPAPACPAADLYASRITAIRGQLAALDVALEAHADRARRDAANWGYAGDLSRVLEGLERALQAVGAGSEK